MTILCGRIFGFIGILIFVAFAVLAIVTHISTSPTVQTENKTCPMVQTENKTCPMMQTENKTCPMMQTENKTEYDYHCDVLTCRDMLLFNATFQNNSLFDQSCSCLGLEKVRG